MWPPPRSTRTRECGPCATLCRSARGDRRRSVERVPSRWVLDLATHRGGGERWWAPDLLRADEAWVHHVPSFDAGLRHVAVPSTAQEHRLRALLAAGRPPAATAATRDRNSSI